MGDSRCFIGGVDSDGDCYSVPLSTDHTPELPAEAQRIYACKVRCPAPQYYSQDFLAFAYVCTGSFSISTVPTSTLAPVSAVLLLCSPEVAL